MAIRPARMAVVAPEGHVCLCIIGAAHGVRGAVKAKCFAENIADLAAYGPLRDGQGQEFKITSAKPDKIGARLTLDGVHSREAAEALRGTALFLAREKLPALSDADDFYHADLIGLSVMDVAGAPLGKVAGVHNFGAGDLLEIAPDENNQEHNQEQSAFYPFTKEIVPQIDIAAGFLTLVPPIEDEARPPEQMADPKRKGDA
ncbi:MAG: ribosome maturation factor RimM [Alphaproteobacteria bacterium]|nr:ribosome maturation factor RimM [Alphaproteobacteria bacterium]